MKQALKAMIGAKGKIFTALMVPLFLPLLAFGQGSPLPITPYQVNDTRNGATKPCVGCSIYTYAAGTTTPLATYTDSTLGTPLSNPVRTNSAGYAVSSSNAITGIWIGNACYKIVLKDSGAVTLWTQDQVCSQGELIILLLAGPAGAGYIGYSQTAIYPAGTVGKRLERVINIVDAPYNAVADGSGSAGTSQTAKIQSAIDAAHSAGGGAIFIPWAPLCYTIDYPGLKIYSNISIYSDNRSTCLQVKPGAFSSWPGGWTMISNDSTVTGAVNIHVYNLTVDGNRANITGLSSTNLNALGVGLFGASNSTVENTIVKNSGDNLYIDCAGSPRTTPGDGVVASGNVFTNAQRNNVSVICSKNTQIINNDLSFANGSDPQAGIDVEENLAGQAVPGFVFRSNRVHDNTKDGMDLQPAHDASGTLYAMVQNNWFYANGGIGLHAVDFTHNQAINCDGNVATGNTGVQMNISGWTGGGSCQGLVAVGGAVGLTMSIGVPFPVSGYFSGSSYDLESDNLSSPIAVNPGLAHNSVHGLANFRGSFPQSAYDPTTSIAYGYIGQAYAPAGVTVANSDVTHVKDASIGSGGGITTQRGLHCDDLSAAGSNVCIQSDMTQGSNKYNLYMSNTALNYLRTGFQALAVNFSVLSGLYPCNATNYGHVGVINDAMSGTFDSVITGGGSNEGIALCNSVDGQYHFH